ncbi:endoribonuclease YbeY [Thiohalobacter thiocyanaticus]|uniref:Endoribonuclease YbeY n=1 Tax=Thiohalobacter thiocyanaticus TaxID=585455 RepID=A0A1Z4VQ83_9GAMM|nr:rRNA maturation RNase YbeY [Thiohalobacter thiocyanaticus]BAZ93384.1 endoribonuclease YbeY [Thiohalobacter thiocyanaticus]
MSAAAVSQPALVLDLQIETGAGDVPSAADFQRWAEAAWRGDGGAELTLRLVDEAESGELNQAYRGKEGPTNVLSFPVDAAELPGLELPLLGDLVICAPVVAREAAGQGKTAEAHWAHMVVHGMLHLQGYNHLEAAEAEVMERLETDILRRLGYPDPYREE